jgi:hypothetical protein
MSYPHEVLAGGSIYAVQLPEKIPPAGSLGGPPLPSAFRQFGGAPIDVRGLFYDYILHPDKLPKTSEELQAVFKALSDAQTAAPAGASAP